MNRAEQPEKRETLSPGLLRQRRNLIAISIFLILFDFADAHVAKIGILGTELVIGEPRVLALFAWLVWAYFLLRYYQYLRAESDLGLKTRRLVQRMQRYADEWAKATLPHEVLLKAPLGDRGLARKGIRPQYLFSTYTNNEGRAIVEPNSVPVSLLRYCAWLVRTAAHATFQTPYVTDFVLPFVVALAAPIVHLCFG